MKYLLAAVSGLVMFFVFPNFLGLELHPLAWVMLIPLLFALERAASTKNAALAAAVTGLAGYPLLYHWLVYTMNHYGHMSYPVSVFVLFALVIVLSLFLGLFGAAYHFLTVRGKVSPLVAAPLVWTALDYFRAHFPFGGFPWAFLANSQHKFLAVIQFTEFTGPYGLTFIIVAANAGIYLALSAWLHARHGDGRRGIRRKILVPLAVGLGLPLLAVIYGLVRIPMVDRAFQDQTEIKVGIVQANVDQAVKWSASNFWESLNDHLALTQKLLPEKPRLIMWPEASVTVSDFNEHWAQRSPVIGTLAAVDAYFLVGSLSSGDCDDPPRNRCWYNSVYLLSPQAEQLLGRYDKMRLVPFSEYVPLKKLFFFADAIAQGNTGGTTPGAKVQVFTMPGLNLGCVICYEVIFPHIVRRFTDQGADFLTTITNDAWFGKTGAPYQHHSNVILRAVENRVYFARSANTGISSIVDPVGRVLHSTGLYVPDAFTGMVRPSPFHTFYSRVGDLFALLDLAACFALLAHTLRRKSGNEIAPN